jgi:MTH538 TIR-like domain (DUF1863)
MALATSPKDTNADLAVPRTAGAFISYSREESAKLAIALQAGLERFAKPWYRLRAVRVFRDDTNLSANPDLRGTIEAELARSGWFILLASPKAAQSRWVESEIQWWLDHRSVEQIMLVQAAGEILWDTNQNKFDLARSSAVPVILERAYRREPRWIDVRWFSAPESLAAADPRFNERVADLAAPIHRRERADIVGENVRQHRRAVRLARGAIATLAILLALSLIATVLAVQQRNQAIRQNIISVARQLAATAVNLTNTDMQQASLLAVEAYKLHPDAQTAAALYTAAAASPQLVGFLDAGSDVTATSGTGDGNIVVAGTSSGDVWRWNRGTGERERLLHFERPVDRVIVSNNGTVVAASTRDAAQAKAAVAGAVWRRGKATMTEHEIVAMSPSGGLIVEAVSTSEDGSAVLRALRGRKVMLEKHVSFTSTSDMVQVPTEDRVVVVNAAGLLNSYELPSGRQIIQGRARTGAHAGVSAVDPTGAFVAVTNGAKNVEIDAIENLSPTQEPILAGYGLTDSPDPTAFALSAGAEQLATAINGRIWVGSIAKGPRADPPDPIVLPGSGRARAGTLRFLNQRLLISGSGTAVGIWDLAQHSRLGARIEVRYEPSCNGCGPGDVLVNPSGARALMFNDLHDGVALVDFRTGASSYGNSSGGQLGHLVTTHAVWLEDDRLFTWDDRKAVATVWTGPLLDQALVRWSVPEQKRPESVDPPDHIVLTHGDGQVALIDSDGRVLRFDVDRKTAQAGKTRLPFDHPQALGTDRAGKRAWALTLDQRKASEKTGLLIVDTASARAVVDQSLDGNFANAHLDGDVLHLWQKAGPLTTLNVSSSERSTTPLRLGFGSALSRSQPFVVYDEGGFVWLYDAQLRTSVGSFAIPTEVFAWTQYGFSEGDRVMVAATQANEGFGSVRAVRLGYEQWQQIDCATAGRDLTADEWKSLTGLAVPKNLRCSPATSTQTLSPSPSVRTPSSGSPTPIQPEMSKDAQERQALGELEQLAGADRKLTKFEGQWVAQVASKYVGISDPLQRTASGSHVFYAADILAEHKAMRQQFSNPFTVRLLKGSELPVANTNSQLFWYTFVFGDFTSSADVKAFCTNAFADLSRKARANHCASRRLPSR